MLQWIDTHQTNYPTTEPSCRSQTDPASENPGTRKRSLSCDELSDKTLLVVRPYRCWNIGHLILFGGLTIFFFLNCVLLPFLRERGLLQGEPQSSSSSSSILEPDKLISKPTSSSTSSSSQVDNIEKVPEMRLEKTLVIVPPVFEHLAYISALAGFRQHILFVLLILLFATGTRQVLLLKNRIVLSYGPFPLCICMTNVPYEAISEIEVVRWPGWGTVFWAGPGETG